MTKIEWTHRPGATGVTWNPVSGCTPISEGCANCYAKRMSKRLAGRFGYPDKPHQFDVTLHEDKLEEPLKWRKPRTVFVCSMGDLFHEDVPYKYIAHVFGVMALARNHTFTVLTKRPDRMCEFTTDYLDGGELWYWRDQAIRDFSPLKSATPWITGGGGYEENAHPGNAAFIERIALEFFPEPEWPPPNLWLGVTVENDKHYDRIKYLLRCPAAVRFVSIEPMLGPVNLQRVNYGGANAEYIDVLREWYYDRDGSLLHQEQTSEAIHLDWVIAGAETGPGARPMCLDWTREVRDQCVAAGVPFFFKNDGRGSHLLDGKEWHQWPQ